MHERKTLVVRNPNKPTMERLPCRLTRDEKLARMDKRMALERTREQIDAAIESHKARVKALVTGLMEDRAEVDAEMRGLREQIIDGTEERLVECRLLEDVEAGALYVFRLDEQVIAQRRDMAPHELKAKREQPGLPLGDEVRMLVDIPEHVDTVKRFDSDPPGVEDDDQVEAPESGPGSPGYGHECEFNEGACVTCNAADPDYEGEVVETAAPKRRKKGEGKRKNRGFDDRAAAQAEA